MARLTTMPASLSRRIAALDDRQQRGLLAAALALFALRVLYLAVVEEDAYITFRVIENFLDGYGLRWNVDERVQPYTHPLWMLLHIPFHALLRRFVDIFYLTVVLGLACTMGALWVAARGLGCGRPWVWLGILLLCAFSRAFVAFSTSGLENSLSHLLLALFFVRVAHAQRPVPWLSLSLLTALATVNRMDTVLLYLPAMALLLWREGGRGAWRRLLLGGLPLFAWLAFAFVYYGFLFPNSAYAKLNTGIATHEYVAQGLWYAAELVLRDPVTALVIVAGVAAALRFVVAARGAANDETTSCLAALGVGLLLYTGYVVYVGGDYMAGRFWTLPFWLSLLLVVRALLLWRPALADSPRALAAVAAASAVLFALPSPVARDTRWHGIRVSDEWWSSTNSLLHRDAPGPPARSHEWSQLGLELAKGAEELGERRNPPVFVRATVGMVGYFAGPGVVLVDTLAIGDPLLARLPWQDEKRWRIGHFRRLIPEGYVYARASRSSAQMHPALAAYWEKLRLVTSGPIWSRERLETALAFNLGRYDALRDAYWDTAGRRPPGG